jgi:transcriptional regulator with XRE-family HTH domain
VSRQTENLDFSRFFRELGGRLRQQRIRHRYTQEDMIGFGFSARHWQQVEAGRAITTKTLIRACRAFGIKLSAMLRDLDEEVRLRDANSSTLVNRPRK